MCIEFVITCLFATQFTYVILLICCTNSRTFIYICFTIKMTLVMHVYIFSDNEHKVVEMKTNMLHDVSHNL